jgi:DNA replication protein DnaC
MLNQPTLDRLRELKFTGMAQAFSEQLQLPNSNLDFEQRLAILVDREYLLRQNRRTQRRLTQAKMQQNACVENIDYESSRGLAKSKMLELSRNNWIQNKINILITGSTGCGKTYISCALVQSACVSGYSSKYYRVPRLWEELKISRANGTYTQLLSKISKLDLLVLDDWGLVEPELERRQDLLEILDDRYQKRSTIINSQLPVSKWHAHLKDATLADAILDRVIHNSIRLDLLGDTMRKKFAPNVDQLV